MYTSYSTLQRKQLSKQVYTDTQSTYLLVYAPGRHKALQAALQNQLHRKFRLVTRLEDELTPDVAGVLLVSEDVECTPTALTYFAAALREAAGNGVYVLAMDCAVTEQSMTIRRPVEVRL